MNGGPELLATALVLLAAFGTGALVRGAGDPMDATRPGASITTLAGACALAAVLPNLFLLGVPRDAVLAMAALAAAFGCWRHGRDVLQATNARELGLVALLTAGCAAGFWRAATSPPIHHDVLLMWWPKVLEAWLGQTPNLNALTVDHTNQPYPRGLAWLTVLGSPFALPNPRTMACVAMAFFWLALLAMVSFARSRARTGAGVVAAMLLLTAPDIVAHASSGMLDLTIGATALLAAIGLARRDASDGHRLALAAAVGAASLKEEGNVVLLVVGAHFAFDVLARPLRRWRALGVGAAVAVLVPFARLRAGVVQTRMDALPLLLHDPHLLVLRTLAVAKEILLALGTPIVHGHYAAAGPLVGASLLVLLARGWPRCLSTLPALAMLPMAALVYVTTSADVHWHVGTTLGRLCFELLPTLVLAACLRLATPTAPSLAIAPAWPR